MLILHSLHVDCDPRCEKLKSNIFDKIKPLMLKNMKPLLNEIHNTVLYYLVPLAARISISLKYTTTPVAVIK